MSIKTFNSHYQRQHVGEVALKGLDGLCVSLLTNGDYCYKHRPDGDEPRECGCNTFWYAEEGLDTRYKQEAAKVGDKFWDGNNGDKHVVVAVDVENSRLAYCNLDQCREIVNIACW